MKKSLALFLVFALLLSLAGCTGCGGETPAENTGSTETVTESTEATEEAPTETEEVSSSEETEETSEEESIDEESLWAEYISTLEAEDPSEAYHGEWYAGKDGLVYTLILSEDGSYSLSCSSEGFKKQEGTWGFDGGYITLDDAEEPAFMTSGEFLLWIPFDLYFGRDEVFSYTPADVVTSAALEDFAGYWRSLFIEANGAVVYASALGDNTDLFIEGEKAALGGHFFGDVEADLNYADGVMKVVYADGEDVPGVEMRLQEDGMLRLTLTNGDRSLTLYLQYVSYEDWLEESKAQEGAEESWSEIEDEDAE